jgi:hypothetical protein
MRTPLCFLVLGLLLLLPARPSFAQSAAPTPDKKCEEARAKLSSSNRWLANYGGGQGDPYYETAKEYLRVCAGVDDEFTRFVRSYVERYEAAVREFEATKTVKSILSSLQAGDLKKTSPHIYVKLADAYVAGSYEPRLRELVRLIESGKSPDSKEVREKWARASDALDRTIDAYARAVAACELKGGCEGWEKLWASQLARYYAFRHDGSQDGFKETVDGALDRPLPSP